MSARKTVAATVAAKPAGKGAAPAPAKRISVKKVAAAAKPAPAKLAPNAAGDASITAKKLAADIDRALSPHALTTVMMARFHIVERVKRALSSDLSRPSKAA